MTKSGSHTTAMIGMLARGMDIYVNVTAVLTAANLEDCLLVGTEYLTGWRQFDP